MLFALSSFSLSGDPLTRYFLFLALGLSGREQVEAAVQSAILVRVKEPSGYEQYLVLLDQLEISRPRVYKNILDDASEELLSRTNCTAKNLLSLLQASFPFIDRVEAVPLTILEVESITRELFEANIGDLSILRAVFAESAKASMGYGQRHAENTYRASGCVQTGEVCCERHSSVRMCSWHRWWRRRIGARRERVRGGFGCCKTSSVVTKRQQRRR